ncbi:hypothetical protein FSZ31_01810 [Sphingorhabdus soli]|uniref:Uncharacterized protein n=1 Tax=Flavisphingopyxis soli TaxID=2601267 RepID=A0A5C6UKC4_9SPHN|nr:hypothetical protein [Sphingorhabdus soli]TXC73512.1 hypothetical protein FSZ31_01810 [Sphingorhabdus soli]
MAIAAPALAQGKGHGGDKDHGEKGHGASMRAQAHGPAGKGARKSVEKAVKVDAKAYRKDAKDYRKAVEKRAKDYRKREDVRSSRDDDAGRYAARRMDAPHRDDARRFMASHMIIEGCPPGLAKKHNGCMAPGQAKKMYQRQDRYAPLFASIPTRYRDYRDGYSYNDGYLYRTQGNSIVSWLPVLGGALGVGQVFPSNYAAQSMPTYYNAYYGQNENYDYRYADRAIFAVDPKTQAIQSIAALLTGDDWTVGQQAPSGYGVYNVPLAYRDRYYDTPDASYRYADGQVYRIDPTTQLIKAAISLLI